jgi:hypothetical protein
MRFFAANFLCAQTSVKGCKYKRTVGMKRELSYCAPLNRNICFKYKTTVTERVTRPYQICCPVFNFLLFVMKLATHTFASQTLICFFSPLTLFVHDANFESFRYTVSFSMWKLFHFNIEMLRHGDGLSSRGWITGWGKLIFSTERSSDRSQLFLRNCYYYIIIIAVDCFDLLLLLLLLLSLLLEHCLTLLLLLL